MFYHTRLIETFSNANARMLRMVHSMVPMIVARYETAWALGISNISMKLHGFWVVLNEARQWHHTWARCGSRITRMVKQRNGWHLAMSWIFLRWRPFGGLFFPNLGLMSLGLYSPKECWGNRCVCLYNLLLGGFLQCSMSKKGSLQDGWWRLW